jgi:hypothetical protein
MANFKWRKLLRSLPIFQVCIAATFGYIILVRYMPNNSDITMQDSSSFANINIQDKHQTLLSSPARQKRHTTTVFCYFFASKPLPPTTKYLLKALQHACTDVRIFSSYEDKEMSVVKAYNQEDWPKHFFTNLLEPIQLVYNYLFTVAPENNDHIQSYDWYVKVDTDSWINPYTFRDIFINPSYGNPRTTPVVISTKQVQGKFQKFEPNIFNFKNMDGSKKYDFWGTGTLIEGFFVVHSHASIQKLLPILNTRNHFGYKFHSKARCAAQLLSGHSEDDPASFTFDTTTPTPEEREKVRNIFNKYALPKKDSSTCLKWMYKYGTFFPMDNEGYAMISPLDMVPTKDWLKETIELNMKYGGRCVTEKNECCPKSRLSVLKCDSILDKWCDKKFMSWQRKIYRLTGNQKQAEFDAYNQQRDQAVVKVPRGNQCFSSRLALLHAVKNEEDYIAYTMMIEELHKRGFF